MNKKIYIILLGIILLMLDQITKYWIIDKSLIIIPNILEFSYLKNAGIAFSMSVNNIITIIISILLIIFLIVLLNKRYKKGPLVEKISLIFVIIGALGNLIDRIFRKYVIDFIELKFIDFPSFNLADIYIVLGVFVFIIFIIKNEILKTKKL